MLNKETKRRIDNARDILVGQLPLPSDQIELITIALIYKFMDDIDEQSRELGGKPTFFVGDLRDLSWRKLISNTLSGDERVTKFIQGIEAVSDAKNQSIPELFKSIFKNAFLKFRDGQVLKLFLDEINRFNYDHSEELGNAFEYLLDTMGTQGQNGQFRTPRNIIEFIVDVVDPQKDETILDPACGTAGFLISAYTHILAANTSAKAADKDPHAGDQLKSAARDKLTRNITGYDITPLMCRLSRVNMYLHHFANPTIHEYDTLTNKNRWGEKFDVILANPPFMTPTGGVSTHDKFRIAAKRAEVLFADFILEHLNANGRAGFIVPEGIIFQNNDDYVSLRKWLINEAGLWAVVSLPANIFQPYSGVKTSVLLVDRALARQREDVVLVKVENDGFSLNTNRTPIPQNDLPAALEFLKAAKQPDFLSEISKLQSPIAHRVVPRADFAKLDAYKAASTAWDFCRKFQVRAERLKKAAADVRAVGNHDEVEKVEKALNKLPAEFSAATGLPKLPATEAKLRAAFDEKIKADAVTCGDNPNESGTLTGELREVLDKKRDFNLSFDQSSYSAAPTSHYPTEQLGELATVVRGSSPRPKSDARFYGGPVPRLMVSDLTRDGMYVTPRTDTLTEEGAKQSRWMKKGEVVLAVSGNPGLPAILAVDACIHDGFVGLRFLNTKRLLPEFLYHALLFLKVHTSGQAVGSIFKNLTTDQVGAFKIPIPPIDEQRAIVAELESYQRVVDGCAAVLDHYRPSITPSPDWPTDTLGHHFSRVNELCDPQSHNSETVNYVGLENLESQTGRLVGEIRHSPKSIKSTKVVFRPGDILYGKLRPNLNKVWLADRAGICSTDILVLRAKSRKVMPGFFTAYFRQQEFNTRVMAGIEGAQLPRVNFDHMAGLEILVPPVEEQQTIVISIEREQATLAGLEELKAKYAAKIAARLAAVWGEKP